MIKMKDGKLIKVEKPKNAQATLRDTVAMLDRQNSDIKQIEWRFFDQVLDSRDFTKTTNTLDAMKLFYEGLWETIIFPLQSDHAAKDKEVGRLIIETVENQKRAERLEEENETLRERLSQEGHKEA